jgi:hypothetical protein
MAAGRLYPKAYRRQVIRAICGILRKGRACGTQLIVHRNIVLVAVRSEFMDPFEELLDRWAVFDREANRSRCGHCEVSDSRESQSETDDPFFHPTADAGFFGM